MWVGSWYTTPVASLPQCGAKHKSTSPTLCCGFLAAMPRLLASSGGDVVIRQRCRGYWHHLAVMRLFAAIISREGIQPERLNAEGFSPSARSRGWSVSVTPGIPSSTRKASERRENTRQGSRYSRSSHHGWWHDTEGYASLHPRLRATRSARAFDLSGRAAGLWFYHGFSQK